MAFSTRGCSKSVGTTAEARFLNGDIVIEQLELLLERDERAAVAVERLPQQLREPRDHTIRLLRILEDESGDRVQRVEQKMRLQLSDESIEARLDELHLEARRTPGVVESRDHGIDEHVERPPDRHPIPHTCDDGVRRAP